MLSLGNLAVAVPAVGPINLEFATHTVVVGPSGAAKTTLFRAILGLIRVAGDVTLDDIPLTRHGRVLLRGPARNMSMAWQDDRLLPHLSLLENAALGAARSRAGEWLEFLEISALADRLPHQVSGGEAQRANLARALAGEQRVILLDEPFHGVDVMTIRKLLCPLLQRLTTERRQVLMITHDIAGVIGVFEDMVVLHQGRLVAHGPLETLYSEPNTAWLAGFLGEFCLLNPADVARLCAGDTNPTRVVDDSRPRLVRPEWLDARRGTDRVNATVIEATWKGATERILARLDGRDEPLKVEVEFGRSFRKGERIDVTLRKSTCPSWT